MVGTYKNVRGISYYMDVRMLSIYKHKGRVAFKCGNILSARVITNLFPIAHDIALQLVEHVIIALQLVQYLDIALTAVQ